MILVVVIAFHHLEWLKLQQTTGIQSFVSVILNFISPVAEEITQSLNQVKTRLISQLINGISRVIQKLLSILMVLLF